MGDYVVYLLRCADNSLYCGITNDMDRRIKQHNAGTASKYTRVSKRLPVALEITCGPMTKGEALSFEYQTKQLPAGQKIKSLVDKQAQIDKEVVDDQEDSGMRM